MIRLEAYGSTERMARAEAALDRLEGVERVTSVDGSQPGHVVVGAVVSRQSVDRVVAEMRQIGISDEDLTLTREERIGRFMPARSDAALVWEDVLGSARIDARPVFHYLAFMFVAGVIACYGVLDNNGILIVGAMAVSPDLLPITAIAVGVVGARIALASRALLTLALGLTTATVSATVFAFLQEALDLLPGGFDVDQTILHSLTSVNDETIVVALFAGSAGMLALESRASSAVGVAISVTTIPAAAYLGVVLGLGDLSKAGGAIAVLATNVVMMVIGASVTLFVQRLVASRDPAA